MQKIIRYQTPVIEITRFEIERNVMANTIGGFNDIDDGDLETIGYVFSIPDDGDDFPWGEY
ncbi:MAG: hypothetical protein ACLRZ9_07935 [Eubacterium sp.]